VECCSYVVTKIATHDFPDKWPDLLPSILNVMPTGSDAQLHGALVVLQDLVEDAFQGEHFVTQGRSVIDACYGVATNEQRKQTLRALAVLVFRACFDILEIVKDDPDVKRHVKGFVDEILSRWLPFFEQVIKTPLPDRAPAQEGEATDAQPESWYGPVALKTQVLKTLIKIKTVFPSRLLPQSPTFFTATWEELAKLAPAYEQLFIDSDAQGRLEDQDGLPFTLDFLVLDELDFLNQCLRAAPVQKALESQISNFGDAQRTPWLWDLMTILVSYSQITQEEEGLWEIDVSLYLAEETSVSSNYTARTACGDLLIKVGEWLGSKALEGLFAWTKSLFTAEGSSWRKKEASLYLFNMLVSDLQDCGKEVPQDICAAYLELVNYAIRPEAEHILRARGYLVAGVLSQSYTPAATILDRAIEATASETNELVQVACIKAMEEFVKSGANPERQMPIIFAIQQFLNAKDLTELDDADDLLLTLLETLRTAIFMDVRVAVQLDNKAVDLLFLIAKHGASNFNVTVIVTESFEEIVRSLPDSASYTALCTKVLPSLVGTFDVANVTQDDPLVTVGVHVPLNTPRDADTGTAGNRTSRSARAVWIGAAT
jgi:importin-9